MAAVPVPGLDLVPPLATRVTGIVVLTLSALMPAVWSLIAAGAARRAALSERARSAAPLVTAGVLALWLAVGVTVGDAANFPLAPDTPRRALVLTMLAAPATAAFLVALSSRTVGALLDAAPAEWLIWPQAYRLAGVIFLYPFLYYGVLPGAFAWPAALGDMATAALAPVVGLAVARGTPGARRWALVWNVFGLVDLIVAPTSALLSGARVAQLYPLVLVPLFVGPPLGATLHVLSLRNLWRTRSDRRSARLLQGSLAGPLSSTSRP